MLPNPWCYASVLQIDANKDKNVIRFCFILIFETQKKSMSGKICNYNKNQYTDTRTDFWSLENGACKINSFSNCKAKQDKDVDNVVLFFI